MKNEITNLVELNNGKTTTTSLIIAEVFGKRHSDLIRTIENTLSEEIGQRKITLYLYKNKNNKLQKYFILDRDSTRKLY